MATLVEMRDITRQYERAYGRKRQYSETVTDATSDAVVIPTGVRQVAVGVEPGVEPGTDALVQYSLSDYDAIEADTAAWFDWSEGTATSDAAATIPESATAVRMTSTGASTWYITA